MNSKPSLVFFYFIRIFIRSRPGIPWFLFIAIFIFSCSKETQTNYQECIQKYVAHAGGSVNHLTYTNSLEALEDNYTKGFRYFELDFRWTRDSHLVAIHDWNKTFLKYFSNKRFIPTLEEFEKLKMRQNLNQTTISRLIKWLEAHKDAFIVTDIKNNNLKGLNYILKSDPSKQNQFIPQIYFDSEYFPVTNLGFKRIIFSFYQTIELNKEGVVSFVTKNEFFGVALSDKRAAKKNWVKPFYREGILVYAHTINTQKKFRKLSRKGVKGIYTDHLSPNECRPLTKL